MRIPSFVRLTCPGGQCQGRLTNVSITLSRRQTLILLAVFAINLCIYSALWLLNQGDEAATPARTQLAEGEVELALREAYKQALAAALNWQPDVQFVGAGTSWQIASGDALTLYPPAWSFSFYSPALRQVQLVTVDKAAAQPAHRQTVQVAPRPVLPDFTLDSQDLLLTFLSLDGQAFIDAHPRANVHLQLKAEGGRELWYVTALDPVTRQTLTIGIDARSREVVQHTNTLGGG